MVAYREDIPILLYPRLLLERLDPSTGKINVEKVKENLSLAIDAYISRVDGCPCGDTTIKLYKGPDSTTCQKMRSKLTVFLKGSNKRKEELRKSDPELLYVL